MDWDRLQASVAALAVAVAEEPLAQLLEPAQVFDRVGDLSSLGGSEPGSLLLLQQALERRPGLEAEQEEDRLQVVAGVVDELQLFHPAQVAGAQDRPEVAADVERMPLGP